MIRLAFWSRSVTIAYTYVGFPLLVLVRAAPPPAAAAVAPIEPSVSVVLAAHNEAAAIGARLDNLVALDYPADRLETIVASDGSDDATVEIAAALRGTGVRVLALARDRQGRRPQRGGRRGARRDPGLHRRQHDVRGPARSGRSSRRSPIPRSAGVAGDQRYLPASGSRREAAGERSYWDFDRRVKLAESAAGSTVAATGAIYAIRRELFEPVRTGVTDDFITSTAVIAQGRRLVFAADAVAWEPVAAVEPARVRAQGPDHDPRPARRRAAARPARPAPDRLLRRPAGLAQGPPPADGVPLLVVAVACAAAVEQGSALPAVDAREPPRSPGSGPFGLAAARVAARAKPARRPCRRSSCSSTSPRSRRPGTS